MNLQHNKSKHNFGPISESATYIFKTIYYHCITITNSLHAKTNSTATTTRSKHGQTLIQFREKGLKCRMFKKTLIETIETIEQNDAACANSANSAALAQQYAQHVHHVQLAMPWQSSCV